MSMCAHRLVRNIWNPQHPWYRLRLPAHRGVAGKAEVNVQFESVKVRHIWHGSWQSFSQWKPYETMGPHFTPRHTLRGMDVDAWHLANTCLACLAILAQHDLSEYCFMFFYLFWVCTWDDFGSGEVTGWTKNHTLRSVITPLVLRHQVNNERPGLPMLIKVRIPLHIGSRGFHHVSPAEDPKHNQSSHQSASASVIIRAFLHQKHSQKPCCLVHMFGRQQPDMLLVDADALLSQGVTLLFFACRMPVNFSAIRCLADLPCYCRNRDWRWNEIHWNPRKSSGIMDQWPETK